MVLVVWGWGCTGRLKETETELVRGGKDRQAEKEGLRERKGELTLKGCVCRWKRASECLNVRVYVHSQVVKCPQPILTDGWRGLRSFIEQNIDKTSEGIQS